MEQLQGYIDENKTTQAFSSSGLIEAEECLVKAKKLADRLQKMFTKFLKTNSFPPNGSLTAQDIDLTMFSQASWPLHKPRLEQHRQESVVLKLNILIALQDYRSHSSASALGKAQAVDELSKLKQSKQRALKLLREAQEERRRSRAKGPPSKQKPRVSFDVPQVPPRKQTSRDVPPQPRPWSGSERGVPSVRPPRSASHDGYYVDSYRDGDIWLPDEAFIDRLEEDLRDHIVEELKLQQREKEEQRMKTEMQMKEAVEKYKHDLLEKLQQSHDDNEKLKQALVQRFPNEENAFVRFVESTLR